MTEKKPRRASKAKASSQSPESVNPPANEITSMAHTNNEGTTNTDGTSSDGSIKPESTTDSAGVKCGASTQPTSAQPASTPLTAKDEGRERQGDDRLDSAQSADGSPVDPIAASLSSRVARLPGEGRSSCHERLRRMARAAGMVRGQGPGTAYNWALEQTDRLFAELSEMASTPEPVANASPTEDEDEPIAVEPVEPAQTAVQAAPAPDNGVPGLGEIPSHWPELPANAQLQIEIAWVSANRLKVRSGNGVDLSRSLSPAPSYSALSWLETSILFPSKFADISVKATAQTDDEKEEIRREKIAIEEIRSILKEMLEVSRSVEA